MRWQVNIMYNFLSIHLNPQENLNRTLSKATDVNASPFAIVENKL